jgi:hypothetical protein
MNLRTDLSLAVNKQQAHTPPAPVNEDSEDAHGDSNADSNTDNKVDLELITSFNIFRFEEVQVKFGGLRVVCVEGYACVCGEGL